METAQNKKEETEHGKESTSELQSRREREEEKSLGGRGCRGVVSSPGAHGPGTGGSTAKACCSNIPSLAGTVRCEQAVGGQEESSHLAQGPWPMWGLHWQQVLWLTLSARLRVLVLPAYFGFQMGI